jgi:hypothetical protein
VLLWCAVLQVQQGAALCPTDNNPRSLVTQRYALGVSDALTLAIKRQWTFFLRNKAFIIFRLMQVGHGASAVCDMFLPGDHRAQYC